MSSWLDHLLFQGVVFRANSRLCLPQVLLNLGAYRSMQALGSMIRGQGPRTGQQAHEPLSWYEGAVIT